MHFIAFAGVKCQCCVKIQATRLRFRASGEMIFFFVYLYYTEWKDLLSKCRKAASRLCVPS